jgi:tight adherence protein B
MITLIALSAFLAVALFALALGRGLSARRARLVVRLETIATAGQPAAAYRNRRLLRRQNYSSVPILRRLLERSPRAERLADELDRAGVPLRVGEFLLLSAAVGGLLALSLRLLLPEERLGLLVTVPAFLVGALLPRLVVRMLRRRRRARFERQLPDALDIISRALRAGGGILASIDTVVDQMDGPVAEEFGRTRDEIASGLSMEEAFRELDRRVGSMDLHIVVTAMLIQREVGGNLAEILDNVSATIRERIELRNEMKVLSSQQRLAAYIISLVPLVILVFYVISSPEIIQPMFESRAGWIMLAIAGALELAAFISMYQLTSSFEV